MLGQMDIDFAAIIDDIIALAAFALSFISFLKSRKIEALQLRVTELDSKLKEAELREAEEGRRSCVEVRLVAIGNKHALRFCNIGKEPARNVDYSILDEKVAGLFSREHVPFPELRQHSSFDETVFYVCGMPPMVDVKVTWNDAEGDLQSDIVHLAL